MIRFKHGRRWTHWGKILPFLFVYQAAGCLPDNAFRQVLGENVVFTAAILLQTITSTVFNTIFGLV